MYLQSSHISGAKVLSGVAHLEKYAESISVIKGVYAMPGVGVALFEKNGF